MAMDAHHPDDFQYQSPEVMERPYSFYAALRDKAPVYRLPGRNDYIVSRHADLVWAFQHPEIFTSQKQWKMTQDDELLAIAARQRCPMKGVIVDADPPDHTEYRTIAFGAFSPKRLHSYEPVIAAVANACIDEFIDDGEVELVQRFCNPIPMTVICDVLGFPRAMMAQFKVWSDEFAELSAMFVSCERALELQRSAVDFNNYITEHIDQRRAAPGDDVISEFCLARKSDGRPLDLTELTNIVRVLLIAGNETTAHMLASTMRLLLEHPEHLELVRTDRSRLSRVLEESLRLETPSQFSVRTCAIDTVLAGVEIPAGARVLLMRGAANRDSRVFADAEAFDPRRPNLRSHISFGRGIHTCLGAPLARLEGVVGLNALLDRLSDIRLADGPQDTRSIASAVFRGPRALRLAFHRADTPVSLV